uniref:Uncharacterized protein n=1 Tax=viral metagenome TaxID=1070528 RepID=A0A6C0DB20_9ZZZZ
MKAWTDFGLTVVAAVIGAMTVHFVLRSVNQPAAAMAVMEDFTEVVETDCRVCKKSRRDCCRSGCKECRGGGAENNEDSRRHPQIDWSKYVLKASIPPCPPQPDLSRYMLKSECPAPPDMSRYILKSAVPPCPPCISTCNKPCKIGECPPCPVVRCPVVECPKPTTCPPCAAVEPPRCPEPKVSCKARYEEDMPWAVRPLLASISPM